MAYERVAGPLGPERADVLHAIHMALVYNQWAKKSKKPKDFLPVWDTNRKQTPEEMLHALRAITAMAGGKEERAE